MARLESGTHNRSSRSRPPLKCAVALLEVHVAISVGVGDPKTNPASAVASLVRIGRRRGGSKRCPKKVEVMHPAGFPDVLTYRVGVPGHDLTEGPHQVEQLHVLRVAVS